eukprot:GHVU01232658.1.p7 GENE.GHVU01232658.1~~GHVU01232658.1.p7  ORF type:complete len:105 (-),score=0.08 GHVU01232658.1:855-1169(-)
MAYTPFTESTLFGTLAAAVGQSVTSEVAFDVSCGSLERATCGGGPNAVPARGAPVGVSSTPAGLPLREHLQCRSRLPVRVCRCVCVRPCAYVRVRMCVYVYACA